MEHVTMLWVADSALRCYTNKQGCCGAFGMRYGEFYYPNGTAVPIEGAKYDMYRNRGDQFIRLNRGLWPAILPPLQESIDVRYQMNGGKRETSISL